MSNDEEWERWASAWKTEQKSMPRVFGRARTDRKRAIFGTLVFCALVAIQIVLAVGRLSRAGDPLVIASAALSLATQVGITIGFFAAMRGTWAKGGGSPLELLDDLERRHQARRRLMLVTVVCLSFIVAGGLVLDGLKLVQQGFDPGAAARLAAPYALVVAFVLVVTRRVGRVIDRELMEAKEARRLMRESKPEIDRDEG